MSDFMSLGRRIRHYRMLRGMTQKALGIAAGFPPETADIRIAQYESGARTPKYALLCTLAEALCVPPSVLDIPRIKSREALKKLLLALEDEYGLTVTITEATKGAFAMENEKMIKVVLLEPGKLARAVEIDASLAGMQKVVGGLIEPFYPFEEQVCIVCNEESKINGMRPNRSVKNDDGVMVDVNHQLFTESVLEEVLLSMPGKDSDESPENVAKAEAILTEMDLLPYKACHPMGLSGGQKQRVAIASAIASERPVILFDEPTSGLDLFHMRQVADSVKGLADSGKTIVIVTHDPEFILRCCNYVIHLENGRLEENYFLQDTEGRERLFNFFMMEGGGGNQTV